MANDKVFGSDITRTLNKSNNNLYDLLKIDPVTPLPVHETKYLSCDFVPNTEKYFIPKINFRSKVRTVRDIRNIFEKDVSSNLSIDIEKQQNILLRKISGGSWKDEKTKLFARNMVKSEKPISRTAWQMVININPDDYTHPTQYVLWSGRCIQVNGSRGGKSKFINKYDLSERRATLLQRYNFKKSKSIIKKDLLKHSLSVKFKPGPLSKKSQLDISYQKYNIGRTELVHLPKPGLVILPEYGKPIDPSVANFLHSLRDVNGEISDKWAEFAVSTLGANDNGRAVQLHKDSQVTFDLSYNCDQRRLLMRHDVDSLVNRRYDNKASSNLCVETKEISNMEISKILDEILMSVEINLMQDDIYTGEDPPREVDIGDINKDFDTIPREKVKRKGQSELHRLDVTVIRLCDSEEKKETVTCRKTFCALGCICDSLLSSFRLKNHCGQIECMFECKCDFNRYNLRKYFEDDVIPGLINLGKENNSKLSKEEQKFHQTVILSGEKSILLKSQRRNWKAPEKYADFYSNMCLKTKKNIKRILSVVEIKLNCENVEPWCMVHNLYKCFCKGKFTEKLSNNTSTDEIRSKDGEHDETKIGLTENLDVRINCKSNESDIKSTLRPRIQNTAIYKEQTTTSIVNTDFFHVNTDIYINHRQCARVKAYKKRKYCDAFYLSTNKKIMELEQNDHGLHKRMMEILKMDEKNNANKAIPCSTNVPIVDLSSSPILGQENQVNKILDEPKDETQDKLKPMSSTKNKLSGDIITTQFTSPKERELNKKLKAWLEPSLKMYRHRFNTGFFKKSLEPPVAGKIALYPWDFIVNRYYEKKNFFLVTNQRPHRIFMAVDSRNAFFNNCIDISTIEDLDMYPKSIKNIITKEVDRLSDQLCILRGLSFCWELIGSVKKCDPISSDSESNPDSLLSNVESPHSCAPCTNSPVNDPPIPLENDLEQSKWFVMTIENDFSEIQFYNKGFFVKHESIIKAINVARVSEKTVRLSSQKCKEENNDPQFGIYAIPNANEYCAFIGPYKKNQPLGIEMVKTAFCNQKLKTRGVWITVNKVDNFRVIDNPLSFMSQINLEHSQVLDDSLQHEAMMDSITISDTKSVSESKDNNKVVKLAKPITITKTNSFYHLTPSGFLAPISPEKPVSKTPLLIKNCLSLDQHFPLLRRTLVADKNLHMEEKQKQISNRPIAEIAPQVKMTQESGVSNNMQQRISGRKMEGGMFILKPEEINSRSLANKISFTSSSAENTTTDFHNEIDMDIENFLANSVECSAPTNDVYVISDDEDYCSIETSDKKNWKDVWIICNSIKRLGWICGRLNDCGHLSFEFPGFKYTEFYPEEEAFAKITQVLARKVYLPEHVSLSWSIVESKKKISNLTKLRQEDLNPDYYLRKRPVWIGVGISGQNSQEPSRRPLTRLHDYYLLITGTDCFTCPQNHENVLTKRGLIHKSDIANHVKNVKKNRVKKGVKTYSNPKRPTTSTKNVKEVKSMELEFTKNNCNDMDAESNILLNEGEQLLNETVLKKAEIADSISQMSNDRRQRISDRLRSIISSANCS